jgi:hypothetical protein
VDPSCDGSAGGGESGNRRRLWRAEGKGVLPADDSGFLARNLEFFGSVHTLVGTLHLSRKGRRADISGGKEIDKWRCNESGKVSRQMRVKSRVRLDANCKKRAGWQMAKLEPHRAAYIRSLSQSGILLFPIR